MSREEMFTGSVGYNEDNLQMVIDYLNTKTYGRFSSFFEKQILNCCSLQKSWLKPMKLKLALIEWELGDIDSLDNIKTGLTNGGGQSQSTSHTEGGSIDGISFNVSDSTSTSDSSSGSVDNDALARFNHQSAIVDRLLNIAIRKYHLDSMLIGNKNYMCGGCPLEVSNCGCSCADFYDGCGC